MAAALVPAVAAQRQVGVMRQRRQYVQFAAPIGRAHLPPELPAECGPRPLVRRSQRFPHQFGAGRQVREPDVVVVEPGEVTLRNAARRAPHRPEPQTFAGLSRCAELHNENGHNSPNASVPRGMPVRPTMTARAYFFLAKLLSAVSSLV